MMKQVLALAKEFRTAIAEGRYLDAWRIASKINNLLADLFAGGSAEIMSVEDKAEMASVGEEIQAKLAELMNQPVPADFDASKLGDRTIIKFLLQWGKIIIPILIGL